MTETSPDFRYTIDVEDGTLSSPEPGIDPRLRLDYQPLFGNRSQRFSSKTGLDA